MCGIRRRGTRRVGVVGRAGTANDTGLEIEEKPLALRVPAVLADRAIRTHDAVRRHDDRDEGARAGRARSAVCAGGAGHDRHFAIRRGLAERDLAHRPQGAMDEPVDKAPVDRHAEGPERSGEVGVQFGTDVGRLVRAGRGHGAQQPTHVREGIVVRSIEDLQGDQAGVGGDDEGVPDRRGVYPAVRSDHAFHLPCRDLVAGPRAVNAGASAGGPAGAGGNTAKPGP